MKDVVVSLLVASETGVRAGIFYVDAVLKGEGENWQSSHETGMGGMNIRRFIH